MEGVGGWNGVIQTVLSNPNHSMVLGINSLWVCWRLPALLGLCRAGEERGGPAAGDKFSESSSVIIYSSYKHSQNFHRCFPSCCSSSDLAIHRLFILPFTAVFQLLMKPIFGHILSLNKSDFYARTFQTPFSGWRSILRPCCWGSSSRGCRPTSPWTTRRTTR